MTPASLKSHKLPSGKLRDTGFCWGGSTTNFLATVLDVDLQAGVTFYGIAAATGATVNAMWPAFQAALKSAGERGERPRPIRGHLDACCAGLGARSGSPDLVVSLPMRTRCWANARAGANHHCREDLPRPPVST